MKIGETRHFVWNSTCVQVNPDDTILTYALTSTVVVTKKKVTTTDQTYFEIHVQDVASTPSNPDYLYTGILVGSLSNLVGQSGYNGSAELACDFSYLKYGEPSYTYQDSPQPTAFWQEGSLTRIL